MNKESPLHMGTSQMPTVTDPAIEMCHKVMLTDKRSSRQIRFCHKDVVSRQYVACRPDKVLYFSYGLECMLRCGYVRFRKVRRCLLFPFDTTHIHLRLLRGSSWYWIARTVRRLPE